LSDKNKSDASNKVNGKKIAIGITASIFILIGAVFSIRSVQYSKITQADLISSEEMQALNKMLASSYAERNQLVKSLPYKIKLPTLDVEADAAILIDVSNGNILYEKNADAVIPPASMTKLFSLYVVEEEIEKGRFTYDQLIPLPKESWACNMPPHSSLMFLGQGQKVTMEELLLGLSICSGNDAAYALAYTVCGSMEEFVDRMNQIATELGLKNTHFVESSGYSELNTTTPREMAAFCRVYLNRFPESLNRYHSVESFTYPKQKNLAPGDTLHNQDFSQGLPAHITMPITQKNTNPLLGKMKTLDGDETNILVDGLKTGYIEESGFNLALTARCFNDRFLSVTMGGKGNNTYEGQKGRIHDGTVLMDFGFGAFADYTELGDITSYFVKNYGTKEKAINLVPAYKIEAITVPNITGENVYENVEAIKVKVNTPQKLYGQLQQGQVYGSIDYILEGFTLESVPLVADRSTSEANPIIKLVDKILGKF